MQHTSLSTSALIARIVRYTYCHMQFNRRRSLLPIATIAAGTLLVYVVLTLTAVVKAQMQQFSGTLSSGRHLAKHERPCAAGSALITSLRNQF